MSAHLGRDREQHEREITQDFCLNCGPVTLMSVHCM